MTNKSTMPKSMCNHRYSRRAFLRGTGVSLALPWLESINVWGDEVKGPEKASEAPVRLAVLFAGTFLPAVDWLEKHHFKRGLAAMTVTALLVLLGIAIRHLVGRHVRDGREKGIELGMNRLALTPQTVQRGIDRLELPARTRLRLLDRYAFANHVANAPRGLLALALQWLGFDITVFASLLERMVARHIEPEFLALQLAQRAQHALDVAPGQARGGRHAAGFFQGAAVGAAVVARRRRRRGNPSPALDEYPGMDCFASLAMTASAAMTSF